MTTKTKKTAAKTPTVKTKKKVDTPKVKKTETDVGVSEEVVETDVGVSEEVVETDVGVSEEVVKEEPAKVLQRNTQEEPLKTRTRRSKEDVVIEEEDSTKDFPTMINIRVMMSVKTKLRKLAEADSRTISNLASKIISDFIKVIESRY